MIALAASHTPSRGGTVTLRGLETALRRWGPDGAPILLMVHGIRDCAATFQFVVDALRGEWQVVAPDWRGHGHSGRASAYWFHDFVADLSALIDLLSPTAPLPIVGHSLGGNIAGIYAGLRPERVSHLISLDGFGPLINAVPVDPRHLMRDLLSPATVCPRRYPDVAAMAARLRHANPRLTELRAMFLAEHSSAALPDGGRRWLFAPEIRQSLPSFRNLSEWQSIWSQITAIPAEMDRRIAMMPAVERVRLEATGHNLHHDAPEAVATLILDFLDRSAAPAAVSACSVKGD